MIAKTIIVVVHQIDLGLYSIYVYLSASCVGLNEPCALFDQGLLLHNTNF